MLKIEKTVLPSPEQWEIIIEGLRNPMNSWDKMDSGYKYDFDFEENAMNVEFKLGDNDFDLMKRLAKGGAVHAKYRRMIPVYVTLTSNHVWWAEMDTYKVGTVRNSCSKMHKIHVEPFTIDNFSHEGCDQVPSAMRAMVGVITECEELRKAFNATQDKRFWRALVELLPMGFHIKATLMLNYEVLHNIYHSRRNHKMLEWHTFCDWIRELPYSELITGGE